MSILRYTLCAAFVTAIGMGGCTSSGTPLYILQNQVPEDGCLILNSPSDIAFSRGMIDTNSPVGYRFFPIVQNNAESLEPATGQRLAVIQGADVKITLQNGLFTADTPYSSDSINPPDLLSDYTYRFSGTIQPGGTTAFFEIMVLPKKLLDGIAKRLTTPADRTFAKVEVTVFGTMGGSLVEAQPFEYFIDICKGCLKVDVGSCSDLPGDFVARRGGACNQWQDIPTDCCSTDNVETCPAAKPVSGN